MRHKGWLCTFGVVLGLGSMGEAAAFQAPAAAAAKQTCTVDKSTPDEAARALGARKFDDAGRLYQEALTAHPASGAAMAGLVRTALGQAKLQEALALAQKFEAAYPRDPLVLDALGEARFRRGEVVEAASVINRSVALDNCNGWTQYHEYRFLRLSGMYGSAQKHLEYAHRLSPTEPEITSHWKQSHATPLTAEERLSRLKTRMENSSLTDEQREGINAAIRGVETREKGDCQLVSPAGPVKLPILQMTRDGSPNGPAVAGGLEVSFNGKKRRMEIDTGASGLLLARSVAKAAGLVPELDIKAGGVGDNGPVSAFVTHVDDIRIGSMEFKNCMVRVLEHGSPLNIDGLIGPDVFRDYLVTLDFPDRELRLAPLPKRPDEQAAAATALGTADDEKPLSQAETAQDRYIAPEMKDWTQVFRYRHMLIFPTAIGKAPMKLSLMDTGASHGMISPEAAREVTKVSSSDVTVKGLSGKVSNVMAADSLTIAFGGVRQQFQGMDSFDSSSLARSSGIEISGLIGFPTLRQLTTTIDYRDNLVHVAYDPNKVH